MEQDVRDLVILGAVTVILNQHTEIIHDTKVLVDDILLGCTCILGCNDMQLLR